MAEIPSEPVAISTSRTAFKQRPSSLEEIELRQPFTERVLRPFIRQLAEALSRFQQSRSKNPKDNQIKGMDAIQRYEDEHANDGALLSDAEQQMLDEELSFYSNSENEFGDDNIWGLLSGVGGNIYEWYETETAR